MCRIYSFKVGERGTSLLEIMVSIALASIIFASAGRLTVASLNGYRLTKRRYQNDLTFLQVRHRFQQIVDDLDGHHFELQPKVHHDLVIKYSDGERLSYKPTSDAITAISLDLKQALDVTSQRGTIMTACGRYGSVTASEHNFGYIGLSVDGIFEMQGSSRNHVGRSDCLDLALSTETGMFLKESVHITQPVQVLIPIKSFYTLYVDKDEQLRYLSHKGKKITENQPLFRNVKALQIEQKRLWNNITCLSVELTLSDKSKREFTVCNRLGRMEPLNYILNRG